MAAVQEVKYPKTPHLPFSPGVQKDDVILTDTKSYSELPFIRCKSVLSEKLDGGNCSIYRGKVYARTVGNEATHASFGPIKQLAAEFSYTISSNMQLFGENMFGVHSIEYDNLESSFYVFAVLEDGSHWLAWDHVTELANEISVPTVPVLSITTFDNMKQIESEIVKGMHQKSQCGSCHPEGFVIRPATGFPFQLFDHSVAKYVRAGHVQTDESWKRTWKSAKIHKK